MADLPATNKGRLGEIELSGIDLNKGFKNPALDATSYADKFKELQEGKDWYGPEYEKHIAAVRARYPMLSKILLRSPGIDNANLSGIDTTNKYARLADAYNAQMRYVAGDWQSGGKAGEGSEHVGMGKYEQVPQLNTQDQKQMEVLRDLQKEVGQYKLGEESFFQRDYEKRKMDEMQKLVDQGYKQHFYRNEEEMRKTSALFDHWMALDETEFNTVLSQLGISGAKATQIKKLIQAGDYYQASILTEAYGLTPMTPAQIYDYTVFGDTVQAMVDGTISYRDAAKKLGEISAAKFLQQYNGMITEGKRMGGSAKVAAEALEKAIAGISKLAGKVGDNAETIAVIAAIIAGVKELSGAIGLGVAAATGVSDVRVKHIVGLG